LDRTRHPYLEPLIDLTKVAATFSFPAFTYEKFVNHLPQKDREYARLALLAVSTPHIFAMYWYHLLEEDLMPAALEITENRT
jgi:hypothetical protein